MSAKKILNDSIRLYFAPITGAWRAVSDELNRTRPTVVRVGKIGQTKVSSKSPTYRRNSSSNKIKA